MCTVRGTTVPTLSVKLTLSTFGAEASTLVRISVFCCAVRLIEPDAAWPVVAGAAVPAFGSVWTLVPDLLSAPDLLLKVTFSVSAQKYPIYDTVPQILIYHSPLMRLI